MNDEQENENFGKLVFSGEEDKVREKIDLGIDLNQFNSNGWTSLMLAVEGGQPKILELLLENGADPNKQSELDGFTALHLAVDCAIDGMIQNNKSEPFSEEIECIKILLKYGADINIKDNSSRTALDLYPTAKKMLTEFEAI